jgi:hypothetical protein
VFVNSLEQADLVVEVLDSSGTVIASSNANGAGSPESLQDVGLEEAGAYFVRVSAAGSVAEPQLYRVDVFAGEPPFLGVDISLPGGVIEEVQPGVETVFDVEIDPRQDTLVAGSAEIVYSVDGGAFVSEALVPAGDDLFEATLPAFSCGEEPAFFLRAEGVTEGVVTLPESGASGAFDVLVGTLTVIADEDFESDPQWTASGTASSGDWELGVPVDSDRGDPPADFDGSGRCYLTENSPGNSDIDNGAVTLETVSYDFTDGGVVSFAYWLNDFGSGSIGSEDFLRFDVSYDGGFSWETLGQFDTAEAFWRQASFAIDPADGTADTRFRFVAADNSPGDVVEAGIDAFNAEAQTCTDPQPDLCPTDFDGNGATDLDDLLAVLSAFGSSGPGVPDTNGDDLTDLNDLLAVLGAFGTACP